VPPFVRAMEITSRHLDRSIGRTIKPEKARRKACVRIEKSAGGTGMGFVLPPSSNAARLERHVSSVGCSRIGAPRPRHVAAFKKNGVAISLEEAAMEIRQFKARCSWHRYVPPDEDDDGPRP
jgi:hypothetical protein